MIDIQTFQKVYGSDGVQFIAEGDNPEANYTGTRIRKIIQVRGYGVPLTDKLWEVFTDVADAEAFYERQVGGVSTGQFIMKAKGVYHRG
jgi:hypothetical protein